MSINTTFFITGACERISARCTLSSCFFFSNSIFSPRAFSRRDFSLAYEQTCQGISFKVMIALFETNTHNHNHDNQPLLDGVQDDKGQIKTSPFQHFQLPRAACMR
eukprot:TRINITY_DN188_c0_g1_i1.p1 TRINITY_DN188_c0_g1~~TRINITY_DN188_c0_g1_i1.p1  ORF type:complete len:106 (-),score=9.24 TRINITY_DN188_c0_g1_i1:703-1020(-)